VAWNDRTYIQAVQFEYEDKPTERALRLCGSAARAGEAVRVTVVGVEVEARIMEIAGSVLHVRVGRRFF